MVEFVFQFDDSIIDNTNNKAGGNETISIDARKSIAEAINNKTDEVEKTKTNKQREIRTKF